MQITNKDFYRRYKNFSGSFLEWFNACVGEHDVFRFWYKNDSEDMDADFVQIISVAEIGDDYLLGLKAVDWVNDTTGQEHVSFRRLSDVREFYIVAREEEIDV